MLQAINIYKQYGTLPVLKGVSMAVQKAEIVGIVGSSGAGKSTLLHILGTLDAPDAGELIIHNTNVAQLKGKQLSSFRNKHIGFVFQFHQLLPEFSAIENICMPAWIAGTSKAVAKDKAMHLMQLMGIQARATHKPAQLSGGEQQRVAIARALINEPAIVLADEPTGNLDTANSFEMLQIIKELRLSLQQTFIIVTHNPELAAQCDKVLEIKDGVITSK
jgi:lipoprotein-releasing system ATP-binding protein